MTELHLPWLELCVLVPLLGALVVARFREPTDARIYGVTFSIITFVLATCTWLDFIWMRASEAQDRFHLLSRLTGHELLQLDEISAPLLPLAAMLFALTTVATVRSKGRRFSFFWTLITESILLATFSCKTPWLLISLLTLATLPPFFELWTRGRATGMYMCYMTLFVVFMIVGWSVAMAEGGPTAHSHSLYSIIPLLLAVLIRSGIFPFHSWVPDFFDKSSFGSAILFMTPLTGVYAAVRLVVPIAPTEVMQGMGLLSLFTAVYAAGMALVQVEGRRMFSFLFMSHSAMILVGLEMANVQGLTGALCTWISVSLSLTGFGLAMRAVEARFGRLQLTNYLGLYEQMPLLAVCFLLTGVASVGFPGTMGYVGSELLIDGAVGTYPLVGIAMVIATALCGIAVLQVYFVLFTGTRHISSISLRMGLREKISLLTLVILLFAGGVVPQLNIASRHHAAEDLLKDRGILSTPHAFEPWKQWLAPTTAHLPAPKAHPHD